MLTRTSHHNDAHGQYERTRRPKPLSVTQRRAIELLLKGLSDSEVAAELGIRRETVNRWRHHNEAFRAALEEEQNRLWLLERAQREIEAAKRYAPATTPPPPNDDHVEEELRRSPHLAIALRNYALSRAGHGQYQPSQEEEALLRARPEYVSYAARTLRTLLDESLNGGLTGHVRLSLLVMANECGQQANWGPAWLDQPRRLSPAEQEALVAQDMQAAITLAHALQADGMNTHDAVRDAANICDVSPDELEKRLVSPTTASQSSTLENFPENIEAKDKDKHTPGWGVPWGGFENGQADS